MTTSQTGATGALPAEMDLPVNPDASVPLRLLIAGVGNLLRGDDGFGVVLAQRLQAAPPEIAGVAVTVIETGIGGIHLVQELLSGYDAIVVLDAVDRGGSPGTMYVLEPKRADPGSWSTDVRRDFFADTHYAEPSRALALAEAVGALPPRVFVIGCQIQRETVEDFLEELTPAVARAVDQIEQRLPHLIATWLNEPVPAPPPATRRTSHVHSTDCPRSLDQQYGGGSRTG